MVGDEKLPGAVERLAASYPEHAEHMRQVARLALRLFDALQAEHGYGKHVRLLLHSAARLHDIGVGVAESGHHTAAQRLILEADLRPFPPRERTLIALIARYHRKAWPSEQDALYTRQTPGDQRLVRWMAALLRVADGLDRTHAGVVRDVRAAVTPDAVRLEAVADGHAEEERRFALAKGDLLADVLQRRLEVTVVPA